MRKTLAMVLLPAFAVAVVGCAKMPEQEIALAKAAVAAAEQAEASVYAPQELQAAKDALNGAMTAVEQENQKFFKNFDDEKAALDRAKQLADQATSQTNSSRQAMRAEAEALIGQITPSLADLRTQIEGAPKGKGADEDVDQLMMTLSDAEKTLGDARASLAANKAKEGMDQVKAVQAKVDMLNQDLTAAKEKIESWKDKRRWYLHAQ